MAVSPPLYLTISPTVNAPRRLAALRAKAANANSPDWRTARNWNLSNGSGAFGDLSQGFNTENHGTKYEKRVPVWVTFTGPKFRNEKWADDVEGASIDHTGWFTSDDQHAKMRGIVGGLSHGRFVAGYWNSDNGERVYFGEVYTDATEAASAADSLAERVAEEEREYNERWNAARELSDKITARISRVSELFALRNHKRHRDTARDGLREQCAIVRKMRDTLKTEYSDIEF